VGDLIFNTISENLLGFNRYYDYEEV